MNTFLNRKDVQADLGVKKEWDSCTQVIHLLVRESAGQTCWSEGRMEGHIPVCVVTVVTRSLGTPVCL